MAIALLGRFDDHVNPLRVDGYMKFRSLSTLTRLWEETGLELVEFRYAVRVRPLAKSMLAVARPLGSDRGDVGDSQRAGG